MLTVSDEAAAKIRSLLEQDDPSLPSGESHRGLRVAVKGGGCSGFQYKLEFEDGPTEMDQVIESNGVRIFIDPKSCLYLNGVTLRYDDGLMGAGFQVENPNARTTCGCGESFSV